MAQAKKSSGTAAPEGDPRSQEFREPEDQDSDIGPQIGTVALVAVAAALLQAELLPAILIGAGAALMPRLLPRAGYLVRPVLKTVIRAAFVAQQWAAEGSEQVQDAIAEVQAERRPQATRSHPESTIHTAGTA